MKIVVAGAGMGGLTLACALRQRLPDAEVRVIERDATIEARSQGYGIGLYRGQGLDVLEALGLSEPVKRLGLPGPGLRFLKPNGGLLMNLSVTDPASPSFHVAVPRGALRELLVDQLPPGTVTWNARATAYRTEGNGIVAVTLEDGSELRADVLVAADGVRSALRKQMLDDPLVYLGLSRIGAAIEGEVSDDALREGAFMTLGRGCSVFAQSYAHRRYIWAVTFRCKEGALEGKSPVELRQQALDLTQGWHAPIREMIERTSEAGFDARGLYDRPAPRRARDGRVVLLGDACHPMTPFRGQGANMALLDGLHLAERLADPSHGGVDGALAAYETAMLPRNQKAVRVSHQAAFDLHRTNAVGIAVRNFSYRMLGKLLALTPPPRRAA